MTFTWLTFLLGLGLWGAVWLRYDRPVVQCWKQRNIYRRLTLGLVIAMTLLTWKGEQWHTELVTMIAGCR